MVNVVAMSLSVVIVRIWRNWYFLSTSPMVKSCPRVLIGGKMVMVITCCLVKLIGSTTSISFYFGSTSFNAWEGSRRNEAYRHAGH
uniref:Uncharacterized protein n=1 Tax=Solanum lycopersicum TaxID=4081 RepID=A0A3Q7IY38_SOLLC